MQIKRILISCLIVILVLCASVFAVSAAEETPLNVTVGVADATPAVVKSGETFDVSISIDSNPGLEMLQVEIKYDASVLEYVSSANGDVFVIAEDAEYGLVSITPQEGIIKYETLLVSSDKTGTLMTVKLKAKEDIATEGSVRIDEQTICAYGTDNFYGSLPGLDAAEIGVTGNPESDHTHVVESTVVAPDCVEAGKTVHKCTVEGCTFETETDPVPANGHKEDTLAAVEATCTETGLTEGKKCSVCGETTVEQTVVPAKGHTETSIPAVAATCTETGLTEGKKCSVCGVTIVEQTVVDAIGHKEVIIPSVEPTLKEDGATEGKKCSVCGTVLVEPEIIPDKNLTWLWILIGVVVLGGAGAAVYFFVVRKKKCSRNS